VHSPRIAYIVLSAALLSALGCHAQSAAPTAAATAAATGAPLSLEQARRVEVLVRQKANLPPGSTLTISGRAPSDFSGYDIINVTITNEGRTSHPIKFLLSTDGRKLAQLTPFDISANPRNLIDPGDRPARGGPKTAPVLIVGFDDLECPYCARLHATIFPAIEKRYGDQVRIVYKDYPLESIHPWAMHASVDVNCLAAQSHAGYWTLVDTIHAHADDISSTAQKETDPKKAPAVADKLVDDLTFNEGRNSKIDMPKLEACVKAQDTKGVRAEMALGDSFSIESTPVLFINGDKIDGALPAEFIFGIIDNALRVEGITPPKPYVALAPPATPGN
jgi:protein-disulfide isomerase